VKNAQGEHLSPEEIQTHKDLGIAYLEMGLYADAIEEFKAIADVPHHGGFAHSMLGRCYLRLDNREDAIAHLERALRLMDDGDRRWEQVEHDLADAYNLPQRDRRQSN
jgi:pilus assembly protein FimV